MAALSLGGLSPLAVSAQEPAPKAAEEAKPEEEGELFKAEQAYFQIDFEAAVEHAKAALEEGTHDPESLARIYRLLGVAAATLQLTEDAELAFLRLIALEPETKLVDELAPRLRGPFLEARGYWSARSSKGVDAKVRLLGSKDQVRMSLTDPIQMADSVRLKIWPGDSKEAKEYVEPAGAEVTIKTPELDEPEWGRYTLDVLDKFGNRIIEQGSEDFPEQLGQRPEPQAGINEELLKRLRVEQDESPSIFASPWFWVITGTVVAGVAVAGYAFFLAPPTLEGSTAVVLGGS